MDARECITMCVGILAILIFMLGLRSCILEETRIKRVDAVRADAEKIAEYTKAGCTREWVQGGGMQWVCGGGSGE